MMVGKTSINRSFWLLFPIALLYGVVLIWGKELLGGLMLPGEWSLYIGQPWSLLTYAFVHTEWRHVAMNVGTLTLALLFATACHLTAKQIIALFFAGTLAGGLLFLAIGDGILVGASAGIAALLPVVLFRVFKNQTALGVVFISILVGFDSVTRAKLGEVTLGVHLIGYLTGIIYLFFAHKRSDTTELSADEIAEKVKISGYGSLTQVERNTLKQ